jgi:hypothetical protein
MTKDRLAGKKNNNNNNNNNNNALGAVADAWHGRGALEPPSDAVIDTLGLSPAGIDPHEPVALMPLEVRSACRQAELVAVLSDYHRSHCRFRRRVWSRGTFAGGQCR